MALIHCSGCGNGMSDLADACPKCGWEPATTTPPPASKQFFATTRLLHWVPVAGFAGLGLFSMLDIDLLTSAGQLFGAGFGCYLLALLGYRAFSLRDASDERRKTSCFDVLEIAVISLAISFIGGFWWGFSLAVMDGGADVKEMFLAWSFVFGTLCVTATGFALTMAAITSAVRGG